MKKKDLTAATDAAKLTYKESLQTVWDNVNKGQRNKLLKNPEIKAILDRFGVVYDE